MRPHTFGQDRVDDNGNNGEITTAGYIVCILEQQETHTVCYAFCCDHPSALSLRGLLRHSDHACDYLSFSSSLEHRLTEVLWPSLGEWHKNSREVHISCWVRLHLNQVASLGGLVGVHLVVLLSPKIEKYSLYAVLLRSNSRFPSYEAFRHRVLDTKMLTFSHSGR